MRDFADYVRSELPQSSWISYDAAAAAVVQTGTAGLYRGCHGPTGRGSVDE